MGNYIIIVDEEDNIIGAKERGTLNTKDIYRVSSLRIINSLGEILLAQRSFDKKNDPGKRGPAVAGTNDEGETYLQNIIKEANEELGLKDINCQLRNKYRHHGKHNFFIENFYVVVDQNEKFLIQKEEVAQVKRFTTIVLDRLLETKSEIFIPGFSNNYNKFKNHLNSGGLTKTYSTTQKNILLS